jgi:hypothetical protein
MSGNRIMALVTFATVLVVAWYASREKLDMGIAVAILGLALAYARGVVAIPVAIGFAAAALYLPGMVVVVIGGFLLMAFAGTDRNVQLSQQFGNAAGP